MRRTTLLPELLAPAGNFDALIAAVEAGADAVYVGGKSFGARAFAENFGIDELARAVEYAHLHSVKLFVTVNTLVYDRELDALTEYIKELYKIGIDAIIAADIGVISIIRKAAPDMPIHASTQMSVHNTEGAKAVYTLGCERVVVARELSLCDMRSIVENAPVPVEYFLHGALCVCHSGQCLFSSLVGGRSGNRGECAQPCRLPYNTSHFTLSLCDLSLANHVKELIDSGVASLKIEGRMKSADYVYNVTKVYRRLLDEARNISKEENELLKSTFSRGGFTDKYFINKKDEKMTGVRSEEDKQKTKELGTRVFSIKRIPLSASVKIVKDEPCELTLKIKGSQKNACVYGPVPNTASTSPLTENGVKSRLCKMGTTLFSLDESDIEIRLDEGLNLPPSAINALRRDGANALSLQKRSLKERDIHFEKLRKRSKKLHTGLFLDTKSYEKYKNADGFFDICFLPIEYFEKARNVDSFIGVYLPPVAFDSELSRVRELLLRAKKCGVKYTLVTNLSGIALSREMGFSAIGDFRLNACNSESARALLDMGLEGLILHPELSLPMARDIGCGVCVYGRIPLMLTERCFIKENYGCDKCNRAVLKDRKGMSFPLLYEFGHRNLIMNSAITYMGDKKDELDGCGLYHRHFIFSVETGSEIATAVSAYKKGKALSKEVTIRRIGIK